MLGLGVHLPLKQGLRQLVFFCLFAVGGLGVHLPLKQGLRLMPLSALRIPSTTWSTSSIKTRITTELHFIGVVALEGLEYIFH